MRSFLIILTASAVVFLACSSSPSDPTELQGSSPHLEHYPKRGVVHWSEFYKWDEATTEEASRADLLIFPIERCFSPQSADIIVRLRQLNPDLKILGYLGVLQVGELYPDTTYLASTLPWQLEFYRLLEDKWAWTTTGDTLHVWPNTILLDPITGSGEVDTRLITDIIDMLERYNSAWPGAIDGVFHDYIMYRPYVSPYSENVIGDIDLDGNGITIGNDENEQAVFLEWQKDYVAAIRSRLGPRFIQVANGRVPQEDEELAGNLNGIFYELFPNMCWNLTDRAGFEILLKNQAEGWLTEAQGRTWSILTNNAIEYNNMFCMLSSMLTGCFYTELSGDYTFRGWSLDVEAGQPLSQLLIEGKADSILSYSRSFSNGEAVISFSSYGGRRVWTFIENN